MKRKDCYIYRLFIFIFFVTCNIGRYYNKQLSIARIRHIFALFLLFI